MKASKIFTVTLIALIVSIVISIQTLQTNAEVGPTTTFHLEFLQSTCNVAMANTLIIEA
jgi:hypothetical protein